MAFPAINDLSPSEFLNLEVKADTKHEYFEGRAYAMAGAQLNHNFVVANLMRKIGIFLDDKPCHMFGSDLRVTTPASDSYMYPDVKIICDDVVVQENSFDTVTNPTVIIEVMSPSTKGYDIAFKFHYYKQIKSLKEYILVDSTKSFIQINRRNTENQWEEPINMETENASFLISEIGMQINVSDIYKNVAF